MVQMSPSAVRAIENGKSAFGATWVPTQLAEAPGRLELLGNHIDYSGGLVLAGAIDRRVSIASAPGGDPGTITISSPDVATNLSAFPVAESHDWRLASGPVGPIHYARGVVAALSQRGVAVAGGRLLAISGDVPVGFGMSSSAALCVSLVNLLADRELDPVSIVTIAREAEHRVGNPVGAMDQSASVAGGVILFNGSTTSFERIQPDAGDYVFAVADSGVGHALGESSYPVRVEESGQALIWLRSHGLPDLEHLALLEPATWQELRMAMVRELGPISARRVDHVVSEMARVKAGVLAIESRDWLQFGELMSASGNSSALDYEISHPRVEELVHLARMQPGVLGARMMGGGEGGPALVLIHRDAVEDVRGALESGYFQHYESHVSGDRFQVCVFGPGASTTEIDFGDMASLVL